MRIITPAQIFRLIGINFTVLRYGLDEILFLIPAFRPLSFVRRLLPWHWSRRDSPLGARIVAALEKLGPVFIKFGQMLSTRRDLLPGDIADELSKLQDKVSPFSGEDARKIVEEALGEPIDDLFDAFDTTPLAAASVAQVHAAKLKGGDEVIVKVLRPDARKRISRDINLLYLLAGMVKTMFPGGRRLRPTEVVGEFETTIMKELDLMREAANAGQLRRNFADSDILYVPRVYWPYCRRSVMVMERVYGVRISDVEVLRAAGTNMRTLAERGVRIFFTQVFQHNLFHADMHPGNLFVRVEDPENPVYAGVDFGIVGTLSESDQYYLAENFLAFFQYDYKRIARLHLESGWVPGDVREDELESAVRAVCEPLVHRPLNEISFGQLLVQLFRIGRQFNMEVQPQLVLLQKTLFNIEGLGRELYPELDLWETAKPFLEEWSKNRASVTRVAESFMEHAPRALMRLPRLPEKVEEAMDAVVRNARAPDERYRRLEGAVRRSERRLLWAIALAVAAIALALYRF